MITWFPELMICVQKCTEMYQMKYDNSFVFVGNYNSWILMQYTFNNKLLIVNCYYTKK